MNKKHEAHLKHLKVQFEKMLDKKYRAGQLEHGDNLWLRENLLDEALNEVIDLAVYLLTFKEQLKRK